ncbi:MAG: argininosuccinate lyase [Alphaproteobacteria bacterium]|nr:argininosuccinate lyase [Alphaproteobacteria bacterium]
MKKIKSNKMWGGRFDAQPDDIMTQINASIDIDKRLYAQDIAGSKAHAAMLVVQNIIPAEDGEKIQKGLDQIKGEIENGAFTFSTALEDIHMNIENRLKEIIGDSAGKLHTARSRNDQVATDFKLWVREACDALHTKIESVQGTIEKLVSEHKNTIMPGFTHLQVAQPVTLGLHLDAYWHMLNRDKTRTEHCRWRLNKSPLGAAALSGTGFPIDKKMTAEALGFERPMTNTMDAVSSRDFATEFLFVCAQCGLNLSRLAEEIILWSTPQFGFITLSDAWSTGSSIMPQKKNPDAAELVRAKTGRLNGNLIQLMTVLKALPLTYNKDLQEDKGAVFESFDTIMLCLNAVEGMIATMTVHKTKMLEAARSGYSTATEIADWLVRTHSLPFREAHHITGAIVKIAETKGCRLDELNLEDMQSVDNRITDDIFNVLSVENALKLRNVTD